MNIIDNQPISFRPYFETDSLCNVIGKKTYCQLYQQDDNLTAQWQAEPCSSELLCNTDFEAATPVELITNGDFNGDASGWTLGLWSYNTNKIHSGVGFVKQAITLVPGTKYVIRFKILNWAAGTLTLNTNDDIILSSAVISNGDYLYTFTATGTGGFIFFQSAFGTDFDLTNVSLLEDITPDCWTTDENWTYGNNSACHTPGSTASLIETSLILLAGYYRVEITVSGSTTGTLDFDLAGTVESIAGNGTFVRFIDVGRVGDFKLTPSSDFDGCVSHPSILLYPSLKDYEIGIFDLNNNFLTALNTYAGTRTYLTYSNDYVNLNWAIADGDTEGNAIPDGCYKLCIKELCGRAFDLESANTQGGTDTWTVVADKATFESDGSGDPTNIEWTPTVYPNCDYSVAVTFGVIDPAFYGTTVKVWVGNAHADFTLNGGKANDTTTVLVTPTATPNSIKIVLDGSVAAGNIVEILKVETALTPSCFWQHNEADYCSNCISIKESQPCTRKFTASCNEPSLGFNFANFELSARLRVLFINPTSKNRNENYKFSDGSYYKTFAERDKIYDLFFDYVDEITHDYINTMLICDETRISDNGNNLIDYSWQEDSYKPEWDIDGRRNIAQSRVQIRRKDGHLTNSNCA